MAEERKFYPFFYSYWEGIRALPYRQACALAYAILHLGITGSEDKHPLTGGAAAAFAVAKPSLLLSYTRAASGEKGGSRSQANRQANGQAKPEANSQANAEANAEQSGEQTGKHMERDMERDKVTLADSNNIYNISSLTTKREKHLSKAAYQNAQILRHGEVSPLMREAAERLLQEAEP